MGLSTGNEDTSLFHNLETAAFNSRSYSTIRRRESDTDSVQPLSSASILTRSKEWCSSSRNLLVVFTVAMLVISTATERVAFKMMLDRMLPYTFVLIQIIFLLSYLLFKSFTYINSWLTTTDITEEMKEFPTNDLLVMAAIDTVPFLLMALTGSRVYPTMTVILMHASTISVVLGSKIVFPQRQYSRLNFIGIGLIGTSILIGLTKTILVHILVHGPIHMAVFDTFIFLLAAILHGLGTLYKEKSISQWQHPIDNFYLSSVLFFYQFIASIIIGIMYDLGKGMLSPGHFISNFRDLYYGWLCFVGKDSPDQYDDATYVDCSQSMWLIFGYVLSNLAVVVCVSGVLKLRAGFVGRSTMIAVLVAFVVLWIYDLHIRGADSFFGGSNGLIDVAAIAVLLVGMEIYDREPEPDVEVITNREAMYLLAAGADDSGIVLQPNT